MHNLTSWCTLRLESDLSHADTQGMVLSFKIGVNSKDPCVVLLVTVKKLFDSGGTRTHSLRISFSNQLEVRRAIHCATEPAAKLCLDKPERFFHNRNSIGHSTLRFRLEKCNATAGASKKAIFAWISY